NAPPPFRPVIYGNFQILPRPTAAPVAARIKAIRDDQCPCKDWRRPSSDTSATGKGRDTGLFRRVSQAWPVECQPLARPENRKEPAATVPHRRKTRAMTFSI